jgi:hypothetical protein
MITTTDHHMKEMDHQLETIIEVMEILDHDNNNTSTTVTPRVGTHANPMHAEIRPRTAARNIRGNVADNDDISSVCSTSSMSEDDVQPVIQTTHTNLNSYPAVDSWINREEWLSDIKYFLKQGYVLRHQCNEWVRKKFYKHRGEVAGDSNNSPVPSRIMPEVVTELDLPKIQLGMTCGEHEYQDHLNSHYDDHPSVIDYGYGKPTTYDADDWKHLIFQTSMVSSLQ